MNPRSELFETFAIQGMSMRDYFAAKTLPTLIGAAGSVDETVKAAYMWADAMMKARNNDS